MVVRAGGANDPASRIDRLLASQTEAFRRVFLEAVQSISDAHSLDEIERLLLEGRVDEALSALESASEVLGNQYANSFTDSAIDTALFLSASVLTVTTTFDRINPRVIDNISRNRARIAREFVEEQRATTIQALQDGLVRDLSPSAQAIQFRRSIGLIQRQQASVENYRRLLTEGRANGLPSQAALDRALRDRRSDRSVLRAIRDNRPMPRDQVERMVQRYRDRYIRYRSGVVARTEALRSVHQGIEESYQQAIDAGLIEAGSITRVWVSRGDERVRDSHVFLHGQERGQGETWQGFFGELRYPGDPLAPPEEVVSCRCSLRRRINEA